MLPGNSQEIRLQESKVREYVDVLQNGTELQNSVVQLILKLKQLYYNRKIKQPKGKHKANRPAKKRYILGMKEVTKHLNAGNLTMLIVATNLEKVDGENGID